MPETLINQVNHALIEEILFLAYRQAVLQRYAMWMNIARLSHGRQTRLTFQLEHLSVDPGNPRWWDASLHVEVLDQK